MWRRRDPVIYLIIGLGGAAGYARVWIEKIIPTYHEWPLQRKVLLRCLVVGISALLAWLVIDYRTSQAQQLVMSGPYWMLWGISCVVGYVIEEVHDFVDRMMP